MIYELRTYVAAENKAELLHERFKNGTLRIFGRHNIKVVGFWTEHSNPNKLVYLCKFETKEEQEKAWDNFASDSEWKKMKQESELDGPITASMDRTLLKPVDYTPQP